MQAIGWKSQSNTNDAATTSTNEQQRDGTSNQQQRESSSKRQSEQGTSKGNFMPRCYNCQQSGHYARDCKNEKRETIICHSCKRPEHIAAKCRSNNSTVKITEITLVNSNNVSSTKQKFMREVRIGKNVFQAQVDMGSSVCTIRKSAVLKANLEKIDSPSELKAFGGATIKSSGIFRKNVIEDKLKPRKLILRVVADDAQRVDIILGRDFT